jgi:uncharacterized protein (TIGR02246 family)
MKRLSIAATATALVLLTAATCLAFQAQSKRSSQKAVREVATRYMAAFNQGDAKALAALWTPHGDYVGPRGELIKGRDEIQKRFEAFFAVNREARIRIRITSVRFVGPDVAVMDGTAEVTPPLQGPPAEARATIILVKRADQWMIESARDTLVYIPSNYNELKELEWMVGDWQDVEPPAGEVSVESTCGWMMNKSFLIRKFTARLRNRVPVAGTQVIGWDPREDVIRSWVFDSSGGFSEGVWKRDGSRWMIRTSGVLQDGSEVSATNILTRVDENTFTFQSIDRSINGQPEPDVKEITIRRKPLRPAGPAQPSGRKKPARQTILPE